MTDLYTETVESQGDETGKAAESNSVPLTEKEQEYFRRDAESLKSEWGPNHGRYMQRTNDLLNRPEAKEFKTVLETMGIQNHSSVRKFLRHVSGMQGRQETQSEWPLDYKLEV